VFSALEPVWTLAAIASGVVFLAAVMAEGRGAHLLRMALLYERRHGMTTVVDEALTGEVDRDVNDLRVVAALGAAELRYGELDAKRARTVATSRRNAA